MIRFEGAHPEEPHLGEALTSYCFGGLPDPRRDEVEQHLMECDACWQDFQRLDAAVRTLRFDAALKPVLPASEVLSFLGLSSRLDRPFGGHAAFALLIASLYGLEWTIGLWNELGYAYDRFGMLAWALSVPVTAWVVGAMLVPFSLDVRAGQAARITGHLRSNLVLGGALGTLVACLMVVLPAEPTIQASFQTRTASVGYLKDALIIFLPLLLFIVPPFRTIIRLQHELRAGRAAQVLGFLGDGTEGMPPKGMWYLSRRFLTGLLTVGGVAKIVGANYMLDALTPGPYAQLFSLMTYVSTALWLMIAGVCLAWYSSTLNEIRREAVALKALTGGRRHRH